MSKFTDPVEILEALRQIDTPTLCNAIEEFKVRDRTEGFMGFDIKCLFPALGTMAGYAVTCTGRSTVPGSPGDRAGSLRLWEAIEQSPKPCVVVLKNVGPNVHRSCHWGDMMATLSRRLGAIGLVTDGGVRDLLTVEEMGFHYFAGGVTPAHGNNEIVEVGLPVTLSGALVSTGDIIHADDNGVATFPANRAHDLLEAADRVRVHENQRLDRYNAADFTLDELRPQ